MEIKFINGINRVTGSCTWLRHKETDTQFLVDCGMVQGEGNDLEENRKAFLFNPKEISYVFLTHSHLDHCGLLPRLYKEGFNGKVYCSEVTAKLAKVVLMDSSTHSGLYTKFDVAKVKFKVIDDSSEFKFNSFKKLEENLLFNCIRSSHIIGSLSYTFTWKDIKGENRNIFFSGDLGNNIRGNNSELFQKPLHMPHVKTEYMVLESTYGLSKDHKKYSYSNKISALTSKVEEFLSNDELDTLIIPTFSQHRYQQIIFDLVNLISSNIDTSLGLEHRLKSGEGYIKWQHFKKDILDNINIKEEEKEFLLNNCEWSLDEGKLKKGFTHPILKKDYKYSFKGQEYDTIEKESLVDKIHLSINTEPEKVKAILKKGYKNRIEVNLDSPMGNRINEIFSEALKTDKKISKDKVDHKFFNDELESKPYFSALINILNGKNENIETFRFRTHKTNETKKKNTKKEIVSPRNFSKKIILTSSGMCSEGKIVKYLEEHLENKRSLLWLTGYQAKNTVGEKLVKVHNNEYDVNQLQIETIRIGDKTFNLNQIKCHIDSISELYSGHIYPEDLVNNYIFYDYGNLEKDNVNKDTLIFLNHGTNLAREGLKKEILSANKESTESKTRNISEVLIPTKSRVYDLDSREWIETPLSLNLREKALDSLKECLNCSDTELKLKAIELVLKYDL